jgi:hypothetical protein
MKKKFLALGVAMVMTVASTSQVFAYGYYGFPHIFTYAIGMPSNLWYITQEKSVYANADQNAYAKCSTFNYTGSTPVLTVDSIETGFPTNSTSFTGTNTTGKKMKYTNAIPIYGSLVRFKGTVTQYSTSFTISASVKG